jgi:hypothetical protein
MQVCVYVYILCWYEEKKIPWLFFGSDPPKDYISIYIYIYIPLVSSFY